jgi:alpha-glucuronidase
MLADAVAPFNGIIMWRAFVYSSTSNDRFKQAYEEFKPLDGKFRKNVLVQGKEWTDRFSAKRTLLSSFWSNGANAFDDGISTYTGIFGSGNSLGL